MSEVNHVTDSEFEKTILGAPLPVIVDFWAPWCAPCKALATILEKIAAPYDGRLLIADVNIDENPEWAMKYGVQGLPTMLFINKGEVKDRLVGTLSAQDIQTKIDALVSQAEA
ncbi:MAG: thioredoxin [Anaerolineaceae bacterium]